MLAPATSGTEEYSRTQQTAVYKRAAILLVLCVILAGVASSSDLHEALMGVLAVTEDIIGQHPIAGAAAFVLLAGISAMFTFVSIAVVVPAAVFAWGPAASIGLLWLGWILGGAATYGIGRFFGRPVVHWLTAGETLRRLESRIPDNAPLWLITLLQLALPSEIPGYVLGLVRYPFSRYVLALGLAELPYTFATVYLGASFVEGRVGLILITGALIALLSLVTFYALRRTMGDAHSRAR
ncbi:MAG TPA: VTT domain-containing protein [Steroidobacteraceae bacterium]|jgi:uncharacterized membrane protein YdjX (TVP38/TMEM64 family)|nr:VTT domain-containing protein [Steroidobacteraceae bacterium]